MLLADYSCYLPITRATCRLLMLLADYSCYCRLLAIVCGSRYRLLFTGEAGRAFFHESSHPFLLIFGGEEHVEILAFEF